MTTSIAILESEDENTTYPSFSGVQYINFIKALRENLWKKSKFLSGYNKTNNPNRYPNTHIPVLAPKTMNTFIINNEINEYQEERYSTIMREINDTISYSYGRASNSYGHAIESIICDSYEKIFEYKMWNSVLSYLEKMGFKKNAARIKELMEYQDFEEGEQPLSLESAQGFQEFICEFRALGEPILGLFPKGTLSVEWKFSRNKHFLIEFLNKEQVSFAMIGPDESAPDGKFRLNGRTSREEMVKLLLERGVTKWSE